MRWKVWMAALAAVAGLVLGGCGDDDDDGGGGAGSTGQTSLTIGFPSDNAGFADLYVQEDYGIFEKHGLDVKLEKVNSSGQLIPALTSGTIDVGVGAAPNTANAIMKGQDYRFIAMTEKSYNSEVWAGTDIGAVDQLRGKTFAVSGPNSVGDYAVTSLMEEHGMQRSDIDVRFVGSVPSSVTALKTGAVDAIGLTPPAGEKFAGGDFHVISDMTTIPFPLAAYVARESFVSSNRDLLKRFLASEAEALEFLRTHEEESIASIQKHTQTTPEGAKAAYEFFLKVWTKTPRVPTPLIQQAFDIAASTGGGTAPADVTKYIDNTFVPSSR